MYSVGDCLARATCAISTMTICMNPLMLYHSQRQGDYLLCNADAHWPQVCARPKSLLPQELDQLDEPQMGARCSLHFEMYTFCRGAVTISESSLKVMS